jgi:hypothetical protein
MNFDILATVNDQQVIPSEDDNQDNQEEEDKDDIYCNVSLPKPQRKNKLGLEVDINGLDVFRIARYEAIFIRSEDLFSMSDRVLHLVLRSNVVVTERNERAPLLEIFEKLAAKILEDKKWKDCASCRFLLIEAADFENGKKFMAGEKLNHVQKTRGTLLTSICQKVEIAQKRIKNYEENHSFITKFLSEPTQRYEDFAS